MLSLQFEGFGERDGGRCPEERSSPPCPAEGLRARGRANPTAKFGKWESGWAPGRQPECPEKGRTRHRPGTRRLQAARAQTRRFALGRRTAQRPLWARGAQPGRSPGGPTTPLTTPGAAAPAQPGQLPLGQRRVLCACVCVSVCVSTSAPWSGRGRGGAPIYPAICFPVLLTLSPRASTSFETS